MSFLQISHVTVQWSSLTLPLSQALHALTHFQTGNWHPPKGCTGWFLYENYTDTPVIIDGKTVMDKQLMWVTKVVNALSEKEWDDIEAAMNKLINQHSAEDAKGRKRRHSNKKAIANATPTEGEEIADGHASDNLDLMLVTDE